MITSSWGEMALPSRSKLQQLCGTVLNWLTKRYNEWVMRGYISKEEYFSEMYNVQLEDAVRYAKEHRVAKQQQTKFAAKASDGNKMVGGPAQ